MCGMSGARGLRHDQRQKFTAHAQSITRLILCFIVLLLSGCAQVSSQKDLLASDLDPSQGVVIFGIALINNQINGYGFYPGLSGTWIVYDRASGRRIGKTAVDLDTGSGRFMASELQAGHTAYRFYKLPPGDYALAWVRYAVPPAEGPTNYLLMQGEVTTVTSQSLTGAHVELGQSLSADARVYPTTPSFSVRANEIVYVGDLVFDVGRGSEIAWSLKVDEKAARAFVAASGAADRMIVRPIKRANGTSVGTPDRAGAATPR